MKTDMFMQKFYAPTILTLFHENLDIVICKECVCPVKEELAIITTHYFDNFWKIDIHCSHQTITKIEPFSSVECLEERIAILYNDYFFDLSFIPFENLNILLKRSINYLEQEGELDHDEIQLYKKNSVQSDIGKHQNKTSPS